MVGERAKDFKKYIRFKIMQQRISWQRGRLERVERGQKEIKLQAAASAGTDLSQENGRKRSPTRVARFHEHFANVHQLISMEYVG